MFYKSKRVGTKMLFKPFTYNSPFSRPLTVNIFNLSAMNFAARQVDLQLTCPVGQLESLENNQIF